VIAGVFFGLPLGCLLLCTRPSSRSLQPSTVFRISHFYRLIHYVDGNRRDFPSHHRGLVRRLPIAESMLSRERAKSTTTTCASAAAFRHQPAIVLHYRSAVIDSLHSSGLRTSIGGPLSALWLPSFSCLQRSRYFINLKANSLEMARLCGGRGAGAVCNRSGEFSDLYREPVLQVVKTKLI